MLQASKLKLLIDCLFLLLSVNSVAQRGLSNWGWGCNFFSELSVVNGNQVNNGNQKNFKMKIVYVQEFEVHSGLVEMIYFVLLQIRGQNIMFITFLF